jgi:hypothetical protein
MNKMTITDAKYRNNLSGELVSIGATIDGVEMDVPLDPANRHYDEIMRQVAAGDLTIADAE